MCRPPAATTIIITARRQSASVRNISSKIVEAAFTDKGLVDLVGLDEPVDASPAAFAARLGVRCGYGWRRGLAQAVKESHPGRLSGLIRPVR